MPREPFLPFHLPEVGADEAQAVAEVLRSGWLTSGPRSKAFEEAFAAFVGGRHAVAVNSCTAALHLALEAIGVRAGDEVIVPTMTFAATAAVVLHLGAKPVLVDCAPGRFTLDHEAVGAAIGPRTKALIPVHYGGEPCEMDMLLALARRSGLRIVEDAAHALPARYRGQTIGSIGDVTCFSFYATKTITTGEGGMAVTGDQVLADRMRLMSLHGFNRDAWKRYTSEGSWFYEILAPGFKYNLSDIAAALGLVQLKKCEAFWERRQQIAALYQQGFASLPEIVAPFVPDAFEPSWHLYVLQLNLERLRITRNGFADLLKQAGIGCSVHFIPLHRHHFYREAFGYRPDDFPNASRLFERIISLPIYPRMSDEDVADVVAAVRRIVSDHRQ